MIAHRQPAAPEVFISYRRDDSSGHAGRLFDCIRERFGDESVFMDVTDISPGEDFTRALDRALAACRVVLVVIGTQWVSAATADGRRRLDNPEDPVRLEVAHALSNLNQEGRVIPVLVRGATMPAASDLPEGLRSLAHRQAQEISDSRWSFDTERLIRVIEQTLGSAARHDSRDAIQAVPRPARPIRIIASVAIFLVLIALTAYLRWPGGKPEVTAGPARRPSGGASGPSSPASSAAQLPGGGEARAGAATFRLLGGLVSRNGDGPQTVRLLVRTTNIDARYGIGISYESFRLVVGEEAIRPDEAPIDAIYMQSAVDRWMTFRVPHDAAGVALQVGDIRAATAKIPIDLNAARPAAHADTPPPWRYPTDIAVNAERRVGAMAYTVGSMKLEHYGDAVPPLDPEKLLLTIGFRVKNVGAQNGYNVTSESFRLLVDDVPRAPEKAPIQTVVYQSVFESEVVFIVPGTATKTVLQLGDVSGEHITVPLDLSSARTRQ